MIDYDKRIIEFGHGDICVGNMWDGLKFQNIQPPRECGTAVSIDQSSADFYGEPVRIIFRTLYNLVKFKDGLAAVSNKEAEYFEYDGWKFYFIPGSEASLSVVTKHFKSAWSRVLQAMAC